MRGERSLKFRVELIRNCLALFGSIAGKGIRATSDFGFANFFYGMMALLGEPPRPDKLVARFETVISL